MKDTLKTSLVLCAAVILGGLAVWSLYSTYWAIQTQKAEIQVLDTNVVQIEQFLKQAEQSPAAK